VCIHGSERARQWKRLRFPKVTIQFGEPLTFPVDEAPSRERQLEVATEVFGRVRAMHEALSARERRRYS
ncbi:MAG TPA: hypothetical protein VNM41_00465, partial [Solirubrobacterales bacterium]|nr:hypothetical protein [Solirubrobacterales bacterium]